MKVVLSVIAVFLVCVSADDAFFVKLWSMQIENALETDMFGDLQEVDTATLPKLAEELGETVLAGALNSTGLNVTLSGKGPFTVFGPTNAAFRHLPRRFIFILKKNVTILKELLEYHVANGNLSSSDLKNNQLINSVQGKQIRINIYTNGNKTVITASGRQVTLPDQKASNGVIHEVGRVLLPPPGTVTFAVSKCPDFAMLSQSLTSAGLAKRLDGRGPFTVFAPTNWAFTKLGPQCLVSLMTNKTLLAEVLSYHVVSGVDYSAGMTCGEEIPTLNGKSVKITSHGGRFRVNKVRVVYPDLTVTNGVVHAIDRVLFPMKLKGCGDDDDDDGDSEHQLKEDQLVQEWSQNTL